MIKISDLSFSYTGKEDAVSHIDLNIEKGSWVSILGHNGSGKSTLAKLMVGLLSPASGTIDIDGILLTEENLTEIRKRIGIVFQNPDNQFVGVTVKHDIAFGLENQCIPYEEMVEKIDHYASLVGMSEFLDKEPHKLSGGQKQRVAIAGALAMEQDIIILDEATSMLDPEGTEEIIALIKKLNKTYHKTIITITHDLAFAREADHLVVLKGGKKILEGTPDTVFREEKLLESSHLELPFGLKLYHHIEKDDHIDQAIVEAIWAFNSNK